ncbi:MAG TPA: HAD family hydrolase [Sphingomonas sp.]|nr:HAD family hydrolase [Sphingomonas sp.]
MKISVRAHEIATLLDRAPDTVETLSLDCFDTLLWRNVHAPKDIFAELDIPGGGVEPRTWAQGASQRLAFLRNKSHEVSIEDIYRRLYRYADEAQVADAVAKELAAEAHHCYPFAPVVALMKAAKARGLPIILVSDTYLSETQLRGLIAEAAGDDILAMVNRIFVSSEYGRPKVQGLFEDVLAALGVAPETILHVGDNRAADQDEPSKLGVVTAHFRQFDEDTMQRLRLEAAAGTIIDPQTRLTSPVYQPHRPQIALRSEDDPVFAFGHDVIGPVMHSFATWLKAEIDEMSARLGKPVRPLFMMRDGYLPLRVFETLYPDAGARPIELSRFVSARASLIDKPTLDRFVVEQVGWIPLKVVAKQLMLFQSEVAPLLKDVRGRDTKRHFNKTVLSQPLAGKILKRSAKVADRLMAHLAAADVEPGDAIMLVDIGYNGTVQNMLQPLLAERMNLTVAGRYMFLREESLSGLDKRGFMDTRNYEYRTVHALSNCVAVIEQVCNIAQGSTVDYTPEGTPIREDSGFKGLQNGLRDQIQEACLAYARAPLAGFHRRPRSDDAESRRRMGAAILARLLFMPIETEVALFERFDQDVNLGTSQMIKLLDTKEATEGLRRRGLSYVNETGRMFVPGEIQRHGLPLNLCLFSASRFGLDIRGKDFDVGAIKVPVILADARDQTVMEIDAYPTAEGYYRIQVPIGAGKYTAAVQLGALCEWVQVQDATFHKLSELDASIPVPGAVAPTIAEGMRAVATDLYEADPHGVLIAPAPRTTESLVLCIIFRPIKWREKAAVASMAA